MSLARQNFVALAAVGFLAAVGLLAPSAAVAEDAPLTSIFRDNLLIDEPLEQPHSISLVNFIDDAACVLQAEPFAACNDSGDCEAACDCEVACDCDGCEEACCCGCPNWVLRGGAIFLQRSTPSTGVLISAPGDRSFNSQDFDFGVGSGFNLGAIRRLNDDWSVDVRYFQVDSMATFERDFPVSTTIFVQDVGFSASGASLGAADYGSFLRSAEVNVRRRTFDWLTVLAGFRYINIEESLTVQQVPNFLHGVNTANNLFGGQLGLEALLWTRGRIQIESWGKIGLYGNDASSDYRFRFTLLPIFNFNRGFDRSETSFLGDLGITGTCQLTDRWKLRAGYQLLWTDGVALASDQFKASSAAGPFELGMSAGGSLFYHGALLGLERTW